MTASDTLLDSTGWVFGVKQSKENLAEIKCLRVVAMAINFGIKIAIYGVHIGATWRTRWNRPCVAAMRPYVKLLRPLVTVQCHHIAVTI